MPIQSRIAEGIIYTEISGELRYTSVIQHIDFIVSCRDQLKNHFELHDFSHATHINISSEDMGKIAAYGMQTAKVFEYSCIAVYANNDFAYGMARMFEISLELSENPTTIQIFRNREDAVQFLKEKLKKHG